MTNLKKTLDLIRKLLAKADSAAQLGSAAEAAAFAGKANELLLQHKLEMTDVDLAVEGVEDPMENDYVSIAETLGLGEGRREKWLSSLFHHVAKAHFCHSLYVGGSKKVRLIGRKSDREIVLYLVTTLAQNGLRLASAFAKVNATPDYWTSARTATSRAKASFLVGYVSAIAERLRALRAEVEQRGGQFALVRFRKAEHEVARIVQQFKGAGRSQSSTIHNPDAFKAGQAAGRAAGLHGGLGGGNARAGTLAVGARLLGGGK